MNGLVIAPAYDSGGAHPHDATGAFIPRARQFAKLHGVPTPALFDNRPASMRVRRLAVLDVVRKTPPPIGLLAFFCHGLRDHMQWGASIIDMPEVADVLAPQCVPDVVIALYACLTGEDLAERGHRPPVHAPGAGEGSFADELRDALVARGVRPRVLAHTTAGDAWDNHYVRVFDASTTKGGEWLIEPGTAAWHAWNRRMHSTDLWARMPFMSRDDILTELATAHPI